MKIIVESDECNRLARQHQCMFFKGATIENLRGHRIDIHQAGNSNFPVLEKYPIQYQSIRISKISAGINPKYELYVQDSSTHRFGKLIDHDKLTRFFNFASFLVWCERYDKDLFGQWDFCEGVVVYF